MRGVNVLRGSDIIATPVPKIRLATTSDSETGVPGLRTWRRVYTFVITCFVVWVLLLTTLMLVYS